MINKVSVISFFFINLIYFFDFYKAPTLDPINQHVSLPLSFFDGLRIINLPVLS